MADILVTRTDDFTNSSKSLIVKYKDMGDGTFAEVEAYAAGSADSTASGNITIQNSVPAGAATAGSAVQIATAGQSTLGIIVSGTYTGALSLQLSHDGTTWTTVGGVSLIPEATGIASGTIASAAVGAYQADISGFSFARITALAAVTGTAAVSLRTTISDSVLSLGSPLPAGSAIIGTVLPATTSALPFNLTAAATTNATSVKATAGSLFELSADNFTAAVKWLKLYNKASAPTVGTDVPILTVPIPVNSYVALSFGEIGKRFSLGIAYAVTGAQAVADTTALAAGDVHVSGSYI